MRCFRAAGARKTVDGCGVRVSFWRVEFLLMRLRLVQVRFFIKVQPLLGRGCAVPFRAFMCHPRVRPFYVNIDTCYLRSGETLETLSPAGSHSDETEHVMKRPLKDSRGVRSGLQSGSRLWHREAEADNRVPGPMY